LADVSPIAAPAQRNATDRCKPKGHNKESAEIGGQTILIPPGLNTLNPPTAKMPDTKPQGENPSQNRTGFQIFLKLSCSLLSHCSGHPDLSRPALISGLDTHLSFPLTGEHKQRTSPKINEA
jgi:hypothetical protein